jgi:GntR family transcriptional regulator/MocR family aminotransferase
MNSFKELIPIDKNSNSPVYLQIMNAIMTNIRRGQLRRGLKMPGSRELASILNIHRKTLQNALDELVAQGWLEIIPRKGTFVVKELPEINPVKISSFKKIRQYPEKTIYPIDEKSFVRFPLSSSYDPKKLILDDGLPDIRIAPIDILMKEYRSLSKLSAFKKYFGYSGAQGSKHLINTLTSFLCDTRGFNFSAGNILITKGAQMGIYLISRLLIKPGDNIIVGEPGYFISNLTFKQVGAVINKVPVDDHGINVDNVETICSKKRIKFIYVIPHHHYPTTVTLIPERRIKLLELAAKYKFAIIEDDYDYDFHYRSSPILPMASIDHQGSVIYIGTLTKTFVPAVRVGFVIAPENFIVAVSNLRRAVDWQGDNLMEVAIAELYKNGTIERHIKKAVKLYGERRDYFCKKLQEKIGNKISFKIPDGGMSVWARFNNVDLKSVAERALKLDLIMNDGRDYNTSGINYNSARLGFASLNFNEQDRVVEILKKSI